MSQRIEFGDFQTPIGLAHEVCTLISNLGFSPHSILEPTCGRGAFMQAATKSFPAACKIIGVDCNPKYVAEAREQIASLKTAVDIEVLEGDFFQTDWNSIVASTKAPTLVLGNPPWVTNATLGSLDSRNLPLKSNVDNLRGLEAITGKSNFDISEWMIRESLSWLVPNRGMLAVLCKTSVARKVLSFVWSQDMPVASAAIYRIDAKTHFNASVDACLFCIRMDGSNKVHECADYESLDAKSPKTTIGFHNKTLIANVNLHDCRQPLCGTGLTGWRSGIKHDCSKIFELEPHGSQWKNGLGQLIELEENVVFPLLKSSDLAAGREPRKWVVVPQRSTSDSPEILETTSPKAWSYLLEHSARLNRRGSSIYKNRPPFSIFGVGPYSFAPWKVGISGLYKKLGFVPIGQIEGKSIQLDDTCYQFACNSREECEVLTQLLNSEVASEFFRAYIFWDAKRPITAKLLNQLDLGLLAKELGTEGTAVQSLSDRQTVSYSASQQSLLFR